MGKEELTNHFVRATAISALSKLGFDDRKIANLSGHMRFESLRIYDPKPSIAQKASIAMALQTHSVVQPDEIRVSTVRIRRFISNLQQN